MQLAHVDDAPSSDSVQFHLTMFKDLCREGESDIFSVVSAGECLCDAVMEICRFADVLPSGELDQSIEMQLAEAERMYFECMPEPFKKAPAARGFAALRHLVTPSTGPERCRDREQHSVAVGTAARFGKSLGTILVAMRAGAEQPGKPLRHSRQLTLH